MTKRRTYTRKDELTAHYALRSALIARLGMKPEPEACNADDRYAGGTGEFVKWVKEDGLWDEELQALLDRSMGVRQGREVAS